MNKMIPSTRPQQPDSKTKLILARLGLPLDRLYLIGIRRYYQDTMGRKGVNDINVYDDALIVVSPSVHATFNFNTDPSTEKGRAFLALGMHPYKKGLHGISRKPPYIPYPALRPATPGEVLPVIRDGKKGWGYNINIHQGGNTTTGSAACQTVPPPQYKAAMGLIYGELARYKQKVVTYILLDGGTLDDYLYNRPAGDLLASLR